MEIDDTKTAAALSFVSKCNDPSKLKQVIGNATEQGVHKVRHAAELRLYAVLPKARPGTLEHAVWSSIYALEGALRAERGKTVLLARTRQKIARDGERKTVKDLVLGKASGGFAMLIDRKMHELTFEVVALRFAAEFSQEVLDAAEARLREAGLESSKLIAAA